MNDAATGTPGMAGRFRPQAARACSLSLPISVHKGQMITAKFVGMPEISFAMA